MRSSFASFFVVSTFVLGCSSPTKLGATGTGDVSNPAALRRAPDAELMTDCGKGSLTSLGKSVLHRRPYLQKLGSDRGDIAFTTRDVSSVMVDISLPDGTPIASAEAGEDGRSDASRELIATFDGLAPQTTYCYSLRGLTEPAGFRTAPKSKSGAPVRFAAFGDSGSGGFLQQAVFASILTVPFDLVLHMGDLAYEAGTQGEIEVNFFESYARMLRSFAVFPTIGNHDDATEHAAPYLAAFDLPTNGSELAPERYYSFDFADVHFVSLDTENINDGQARWLEQDLSSTEQPWRVVFGHHPPHSSGEHGPDLAFQRLFVPLIEKYGVKLVLSGHEHDYERFKPINGVTYVVTGGGGRETRSVGWGPMTGYSEDVLHFVYVEIEGDVLTLHAIDGLGREFDSARIDRSL